LAETGGLKWMEWLKWMYGMAEMDGWITKMGFWMDLLDFLA